MSSPTDLSGTKRDRIQLLPLRTPNCRGLSGLDAHMKFCSILWGSIILVFRWGCGPVLWRQRSWAIWQWERGGPGRTQQ